MELAEIFRGNSAPPSLPPAAPHLIPPGVELTLP